MKKLIAFFLVAFVFGTALFAKESSSKKIGSTVQITNHSFLNEEHVDSKITITGRLSAKENVFVLNENPDSRSVVTFNLKVKRWGLKRKLRKLDGQTVTLTGKLLEAPSPWKKTMSVLSLD